MYRRDDAGVTETEQEIYADHFSSLQGSQEGSQENLSFSKR